MSAPAVVAATGADDPFALDVQVITDVPAGHPMAPCTTNDGCAPTCASSCVSGGV